MSSAQTRECGCGSLLIGQVERATGKCDRCARLEGRDDDPPAATPRRARPTTERLRCTDCSAVLFTEEEEANEMCQACLRRSA